MTKTKKLDMELPKEGRFISSEFPILRENLGKIDQALLAVEEKVEGKAPLHHTHTISDVTGLESALNGKMAVDKTFTFADLSDIEGAKDAANNYVLYKSSNNNFTFGSAISLLGTHQHKTEDIVGLDDFRAKINEDLTAYGHLTSPNEWQSYNKFTSKVSMSGGLELLGNLSFNLIHNGEIVTRLSANGSVLKGPLTVDGEAVYTKSQVDKLIASLVKKPVEILMTESGPIPFPEGVSDDTEVEIWAWGGGGGGGDGGRNTVNNKKTNYGGGGGGGAQNVHIKIKVFELKKSTTVQIGCGGHGGGIAKGGDAGGTTRIGNIVTAFGGAGGGGCGGSGGSSSFGGSRGGNSSSSGFNGLGYIFSGGNGGDGGSGNGGSSIFGGGGGGGGGAYNGAGGFGGESEKAGNGGHGCKGNGEGGGGGGGYFNGNDGGINCGGDGGNGAILLKFFI
ncbi:Bgr_08870 family protein [Bartonella sp. MM73XJBT]|uniref:Bgr_08870 family protein n=1 Tax=Bartonella sp. MM73XJBT TaxID=3019095 RepID=UPI00235FB3F7|nr:Bgr_08870 family protein [Bartonella sp. MM73XJBT]